MSVHFSRMVQLADDFFAAKQDPDQLDVTPEVIARLEALHSATLSEEIEGDGPVVWVLLIPTSASTKERFLSGQITERILLEETTASKTLDALYLCSVLVLPEFRRQGRAFRTAVDAVEKLMKDFPIKSFYTWNFSDEGKLLADRLAERFNLPLYYR